MVRVEVNSSPTIPRLMSPQLTHETRCRFLCTMNITGVNISFAQLLNTYLFASSAVQGYQVFKSVRIKFIEVWSPPTTPTSNAPAIIQFFGSGTSEGDALMHQCQSQGMSLGHMKVRPKNSFQTLYRDNSAGQAFQISCDVNTVIDLGLSFRDIPNTAAVATAALVAATTGAMYFRGFDGLAVSGTNFLPQLPTGMLQ